MRSTDRSPKKSFFRSPKIPQEIEMGKGREEATGMARVAPAETPGAHVVATISKGKADATRTAGNPQRTDEGDVR